MNTYGNNDVIKSLCSQLSENSHIEPSLYEKFHVKRGLRRSDGTGVMAGITNICNVHGYIVNEGEKEPIEGKLVYRGYNINDIVSNIEKEDRFGFEETAYLLFHGQASSKIKVNEACFAEAASPNAHQQHRQHQNHQQQDADAL